MAIEHQFLTYRSSAPTRLATELSVQLANYYGSVSFSRSRWKKQPQRVCHWRLTKNSGSGDGSLEVTQIVSAPFTAETIREEMISTRAFNAEKHNLPTPACDWLDDNIDFSTKSHITDHLGQTVKMRARMALGPSFPLAPLLDREGAAYTSFQRILLQTVFDTRAWLVENSAEFSSLTWLERLRIALGESVSLVENTLHQLYYKAQYSPLPSWSFDEAKLTKRHGSRTVDKLRWVKAITGCEWNAGASVAALNRIKAIRNHLQHFDPPVFAYTIEDAAGWLNDVRNVAELVWQIRACAGGLPSVELIKLLLSPEVDFNTMTPDMRRSKQASVAGYASVSERTLQSGVHWSASDDQATITLRSTRREEVVESKAVASKN